MSNYASVVKIPDPQKEPLDMNHLIQQVLLLFGDQLNRNGIHLIRDLSDHSPVIHADRPQLEQVLVNILKNSIEAIDQQGSIVIRTSDDPLHIRILDNGRGIPEGSQSKIFTPFYSEKKNGQGIGLTFIREVLLAHQFTFSLSSNADGWTEFLIRF